MWMLSFNFPPTANSPAPGPQHESVEAALEASGASGTGSILDIQTVGDVPGFLTSWALSTDELQALFGTDKPTRQLLEDVIADQDLSHWQETGYDVYEQFWETIGRGESRYIILYEDEQPSEIFFVDYSVD